MLLRLLALLGLLAAAVDATTISLQDITVPEGVVSCEHKSKFHCKDNKWCVLQSARCNGDKDCLDGSDEAGCEAFPKENLPVNALVEARVEFAAKHGAIEVHLCGDIECSMVELLGVKGDGTLQYETRSGCSKWGRDCDGPVKNHSTGEGAFPSGEVVLEVQRRSGELAVWRQGQPNDKVTVPVGEDYSTLRVRPSIMDAAMPVRFRKV